MKKFFTLIALTMFGMVLQVKADTIVLFEGSCYFGDFDDTDSTTVKVTKDKLTGLVENMTLQMEMETHAKTKKGRNAYSWMINIKGLEISDEEFDSKYYVKGGPISIKNGTTTYSVDLTAAEVAMLKQYGMKMTGCNITMKKVSLVSKSSSEQGGDGNAQTVYKEVSTLMEGNVDMGNWDENQQVTIESSKFQDIKQDAALEVTLKTNDAPTNYPKYRWTWELMFRANAPTIEDKYNITGNRTDWEMDPDYPQTKIQENATSYVLKLNDSDIELLKEYGLVITGCNVTVSKVTLGEMVASSTGIKNIDAGIGEGTTEFFSIDGRMLSAPQKGIVIVRKNGETRKVVFKN